MRDVFCPFSCCYGQPQMRWQSFPSRVRFRNGFPTLVSYKFIAEFSLWVACIATSFRFPVTGPYGCHSSSNVRIMLAAFNQCQSMCTTTLNQVSLQFRPDVMCSSQLPMCIVMSRDRRRERLEESNRSWKKSRERVIIFYFNTPGSVISCKPLYMKSEYTDI